MPADRLSELLAAQAVAQRLDDAEWRELEELAGAMPAEAVRAEQESLREAAALTQAAFLAEDRAAWRQMPGELRDRLLAMGRARAVDAPVRPRRRRTNLRASWGWATAAAMAIVWLVAVVLPQTPPSAVDSRAIQAAADVVRLPWASEIADYAEVRGEITWSDALQAGEMRFSGLPANDPSQAQYQLWIVDPDRHANPVDGGVFDASPSGEFAVATRAKLPVDQPVAFAVTLEQAGGVVVSDGPLLLVAAAAPRPHTSL
ncbi:anti-sigma factor domain-containing protein [Candidatus Foliamicus sp.]